jgi:hypothetical protein
MQERKLDLGQSKNNLYQLTADGNVMSSRVCVHVAIVTCFCCVKTTRESLNAEDVGREAPAVMDVVAAAFTACSRNL